MKRWRIYTLLLLLAAPAFAQEKTVPQTSPQITYSFAPVVKKAAPAVVNIYTRKRVAVAEQNLSPFMTDPFFRQFFGQNALPGRTREQMISSLGSGVLVKSDGTIVTAYHVIKDAQEIRVVLADKREFEAKVTLKDPQADLAFLHIDAKDLPYLEMRDSDSLEVGDLVLAIGDPFGVGQTVTNGIVSALARSAAGVSDYQFFIQTDAPINPGNSGGALVDMQARLIGINTAIYSRSGGSQGIGFAIPANMVRSLIDNKSENGHVVRPWLGVAVQPVTSEIAESLGMAAPQGTLVKEIYPGSPAEKAGLKIGDVILSFNDTPIASSEELQYRLALVHVGDTAKFSLLRGGKPMEISLAMTAPPETVKRDQRTLSGRHPLSGVTVANISPALMVELGLEELEGQTGVVVVAGNDSQPVLGGAFAPGDIILQVNRTKITSTGQLEKLMKSNARGWQIVYQRNGQMMTLSVTM